MPVFSSAAAIAWPKLLRASSANGLPKTPRITSLTCTMPSAGEPLSTAVTRICREAAVRSSWRKNIQPRSPVGPSSQSWESSFFPPAVKSGGTAPAGSPADEGEKASVAAASSRKTVIGMFFMNELGLPIWFAVPGRLDGCLATVAYFRLMSSGVSVEASIARIVSRTHLAFMSISSLGKSFSSFSK